MGLFCKLDTLLALKPKILNFSIGSFYHSINFFREPFLSQHLQFQKDDIGTIMAAISISSFLASMLWNRIADASGRHKAMMSALSVGMCVSFLGMYWYPDGRMARFWWCISLFSAFGAFMGGILPLTDHQTLTILEEDYGGDQKIYGRQRLFSSISFAAISSLGEWLISSKGVRALFLMIPSAGVFMNICLWLWAPKDSGRGAVEIANEKIMAELKEEELKSGDHKDNGHGEGIEIIGSDEDGEQPTSTVNVLMGRIGDSGDGNGDVNFSLPAPDSLENINEADDDDAHSIKTTKTAVGTIIEKPHVADLLRDPKYMTMIVFAFICDVGYQLVQSYLRHILRNIFELNSLYINACIWLSTIACSVGLFMGKRMLTMRIWNRLLLAILFNLIRLWSYWALCKWPTSAFAQSKNFVCIFCEILTGLSFALIQVSGVQTAALQSPIGLEATSQSIFIAMHVHFPCALASIGGGYLLKYFNDEITFLVVAVLVTLLGIFSWIALYRAHMPAVLRE